MERESPRPARGGGFGYQSGTPDVLSLSKSSREAEYPPRILATHYFRSAELRDVA